MAVVVFLYSLIQAFEFAATIARFSGVLSGQPLLGYSIQQVIYMGTRFMLVMMIPFLGYIVDSQPGVESFRQMTHLALIASSFAGFLLLSASKSISSYFVAVINIYAVRRNLLASFFQALHCDNQKYIAVSLPTLQHIASNPNTRKLLMLSTVVFSLYSTGLFFAFYLSILFPSNRVMLSQTSGVFTALGALLLSFVIEPKVSYSIDNNETDAPSFVMSIFHGRLLALALAGQITLSVFYIALSFFS